MDTSKEYIEMCKSAEEIQLLKENFNTKDHFIPNLYSYDEGRSFHTSTQYEHPDEVWLPRQDQLSGMIETWNKKYSTAFFENIVSNSVYRGIERKGFDSLEKHLLAFVMNEKYKKVWNKETKIWDYKG